MHTPHYEEHTVNEVVQEIPEAGHVLRSFDVEAANSSRLSLTQAAQSVSVEPDDMLAVLDYRARRAANRSK